MEAGESGPTTNHEDVKDRKNDLEGSNLDTDCGDNGKGDCRDGCEREDCVVGLVMILVMAQMRGELVIMLM